MTLYTHPLATFIGVWSLIVFSLGLFWTAVFYLLFRYVV